MVHLKQHPLLLGVVLIKKPNYKNLWSDPKMTNEVQTEMAMPKYLICEFKQEMGVISPIFDLKLEDLVYEKMFILFEKLQPLNNKIAEAEVELQTNKDKLLLETDFKKELGENRPTIAMKEAYMKPLLAEYEDKVDELTDSKVWYNNKLTILNDLIKTRRLELKIEGNLHEEE